LNINFLILILLLLTSCREALDRKPLGPTIDKDNYDQLTSPVEDPSKVNQKQKSQVKDSYPKEILQKISVTITETQPLKNFLIEISRQTKVDLQLDPNITKAIHYTATDVPFIEVIEQICDLANLRFTVIGKSIRIEPDSLYSQNYNIQFLSVSRKSENQISTATDVFTGAQQGKTGDNGSNSSINVTGNSDFWAELETNLDVLLAANGGQAATYSIHRQAGIITVMGNSRHHKIVKNYLDKLRGAASSQVLIEAKIVEVILRDEFKSGINWAKVGKRTDWVVSSNFGNKANSSRFLSPSSSQTEMIRLGAQGQTFSAILNALEEFGVSRTLSSPRLTVMNNQTAVLKVAQNQVYFKLKYEKQFSTQVNREDVSVSSDIQTVPIGLIMSVQPSIDPETGEIILFLRPTISRLSETVTDPAVEIAYNANINANNSSSLTPLTPSKIPVVEVREIDSVLRLKDNEIAVMGGLMEVRSINDTSKLPIIGDVPLAGELFKSNTDGNYVVELVILLKATIKNDGANPHPADIRAQSYIKDPRPL
jgi:MSHA type pilus biogenesis protein MshL